MSSEQENTATRLKVGVFTLLGVMLIAIITVYVNDRPYWWRGCDPVKITIEDATGLKAKSAVRSLGLEIGYLESVSLSETNVELAICVTAPVEVLDETKAYIRGEGFLGDKFIELKPVRYIGKKKRSSMWRPVRDFFFGRNAYAARSRADSRHVPVDSNNGQNVQEILGEVDGLVSELTDLTKGLKSAINPKELNDTLRKLNKTLDGASAALSPRGGLNQTALRTLNKLEDAIEQLRDQIARVNQGQGSIGKLLNDDRYADQIDLALRNLNKLLNRAAYVQFVMDIGADIIPAYDSTRSWVQLGIWPKPTRYYKLGVSIDPRGRLSSSTTTTTVGSASTTTTTNKLEYGVVLFTALVGTIVMNDRLDLFVGALHGDGALGVKGYFGPTGNPRSIELGTNTYFRAQGVSGTAELGVRVNAVFRPWSIVYLRGGLESFKQINGKTAYSFGAGINFNDEDIALLFSFL